MALEDSVLAAAQRLSHRVVINGVNVSQYVTRINISQELSEGNAIVVTRCEIGLPDTDANSFSWISRGQSVSVDLGYDGFLRRRFTGYVYDPEGQFAELRVICLDELLKLTRVAEFPERDVTGQEVAAAVEGILGEVGIGSYNVSLDSTFTLGSVAAALIEAGPSAQMVADLLDIKDGYLWALRTGEVVARTVHFQPAPSAYAAFGSGDDVTPSQRRVLDGADHTDPQFFRNRVVATGFTPEADEEDEDPPEALESVASLTSGDLQRPAAPAGIWSAEPYANFLIDTQSELDAYALRKLSRRARVPRYVTVDQVGNPFLELGMTLQYSVPRLRLTGRWFVFGIEEEYSRESGYQITLQLTGGDEAGGSLGLNPHALVSWVATQEPIGGVMLQIITVDASASFDSDGTIVSIEFTGDITGTGPVLTVALDPDSFPDGITFETTVTDNDGLTDVRETTIPIEPEGVFFTLPAVGVAHENGWSYSPDEMRTWRTFLSAGAKVVALRPADGEHVGHAVAGFEDGHIELTTDGLQTDAVTVLGAVGSPIECVAWDWRNTLRVWAMTRDGRLYVSITAGASWGLYGGLSLRTTLGLPNLLFADKTGIGLPAGAFGSQPVYIFATDGAGMPVIAYDNNLTNDWGLITFGGELASDLPGPNDLELSASVAPSGVSGTMIGFRNKGAGMQALYWQPPGGDPSTWKRAQGAVMGLDGVAFVEGDAPLVGPTVFRAMFEGGDRASYHTEDGITWTEIPDVAAADHSVNFGLFLSNVLTGLPNFAGIYLTASEAAATDGRVDKSIDALTTLAPTWPAGGSFPAFVTGGKAKHISIGAPGVATPGTSGEFIKLSTGALVESWQPGSEFWTAVGDDTDPGSNAQRLMWLPSSYLVGDDDVGTDNGSIYHTTDLENWTATLGPDATRGVVGFELLSDGSIIAVRSAQGTPLAGSQATEALQVFRSDDGGATWDLVHTDPGWDSGDKATHAIFNGGDQYIACDKWSKKAWVMCAGASGIPEFIWTNDAENGPWSQEFSADITEDPPHAGNLGTGQEIMFVNSGRILIAADHNTDPSRVYYHDNLGLTGAWTIAREFGNDRLLFAPYRASHFNRVVLAVVEVGGTTTEIWISENNGASFALATTIPDGVTTLGDFSAAAIDYDFANDRAILLRLASSQIGVRAVEGLFSGSPTTRSVSFNAAQGNGANHKMDGAFRR